MIERHTLRYSVHISGSNFCIAAGSSSFLLVRLCESSHTPSKERTKVSDSGTAVITKGFIMGEAERAESWEECVKL